MSRLLIIGGGIAGLAAAWRARSLSENGEVTVLEKDARLGGKILTERRDGFVLDAGADGFLSRKPAGVGLCEELGITELLRGQVPRTNRSFVMRAHKLHPLPQGFSGLVPANLQALQETPLLSAAGKLKAMEEPSVPPRRDPGDESVSQFMTRRFGSEAFEALIEPLLAGIYAGDASCLSMEATFPNLRELEQRQGSVLAGLRRQEAGPTSSSAFVTFARGVGELVEALSESLQAARVRLITGAEATAVRRRGGPWRVELSDGALIDAEAVILAVPSGVAARLLDGVDPELSAALGAIPCTSTAVIHLGFRRADLADDLDGYGYVIPRREGSDLRACTWTSSKWEGRAPRGMVLVRLYARRLGSDEDLEVLARAELRDTMGIAATPELTRIFRWPDAMPQYTLGHPRRLETIQARCAALEGLFLAGASYRGVGIPDCIESGFQAGTAALEHMR